MQTMIPRPPQQDKHRQKPSLEQSYRFGFHRFWSVLLVSVLVGLATVAGLILVVELGLSNPQHPTAAQPN